MGRATVYILLFLVFFNSGAVMLQETGLADAANLNTQTGDPEELQNYETEVDPAGGGGSTLFGLFAGFGDRLASLFGGIMPGIDMLSNVGVPSAFLGYATSGISLVMLVDLLSYIPGRDLL